MKTSIKTILAGTLVFTAFFGVNAFAYANQDGTTDLWDVLGNIVCGNDGCVVEEYEDQDDGIYWRGGDPIVATLGATTITRSSVMLQAHYDSVGADYNMTDLPKLYMRFGEDSDMDRITSPVSQGKGSRTVSFQIANLDADTRYYYQAVLIYRGGHVAYGDQLSFRTLKTGQVPVVDCSFDSNTWLFPDVLGGNGCVPNGTVSSQSVNTNTQPSSNQSSNSTNTAPNSSSSGSRSQVAGISQTSNEGVVTGSSGNVSLRITNSESQFEEGDKVRFSITISNTGTMSARNGRLVVTLPTEYAFVKSSEGSFDERDNELAVRIATIAGGASKTITVDARVSDVKDDDSVTTRAVLTFTKSNIAYTVRASDTDDIEAASGNILGASVFGAGFFPQTLAGWVILIIIITALIFVIRRYSQGDTK